MNMTVNQASFFCLFFLFVIIYYLVPKKTQWMLLLGMSLLIYYLMGVHNFLYVLVTTLTLTYGAEQIYQVDRKLKLELKDSGKNLSKEDKKVKKAAAKLRKRGLLTVLLVINIGILFVLKYDDFLIGNINRVLTGFGLDGLNKLGLVAPLGISYYTLQAVGYAIEVFKGKCLPEKNPLKLLLYVTYFPQMTQGPIGRYPDLAPQLFAPHVFSYRNLSFGCQRILWGCMKKRVIADQLKPGVKAIFSHYKELPGMTLFMGCILMTIQAYADFSAYSDIVCGVSEILGIRLMENFNRPFFSKSLAEYWRRWHISLSSWFRDYVFYPASVSKGAVRFGKLGKRFFSPRISKLFPAVYALGIVWFCTGIWHDSSWRYITWGVANGVIIISAMILEPQFAFMKQKLHIPEDSRWWKGFCMLRTFLIVASLKIFPGAGSTMGSLRIAKRILLNFSPAFTYEAFFYTLAGHSLLCACCGLVCFVTVSVLQNKGSVREMLAQKPSYVRWVLYLLIIAMTLCMGRFSTGTVGGFEYAHY